MEKNSGSKKIWGWLALVSALVAICFHGYLTWEFYQLKLGLGAGKSVCNVSSTFNCEVVAVSSYASFFDIPTAMWGFWTNLIFVLILTASLLEMASNPRRSARFATALASLILLASISMFAISSAKLGVYCLFCIGAYVCSILTFVGTSIWSRSLDGDVFEDLKSSLLQKSTWVFLILIPALAYIGNRAMLDNYGAGKLNILVQESLNDFGTAPVNEFDLSKGLSYQASDEPAKVTIVEFVDLFCPHCKVATPSIHAFAEGRKDLKLVVKIFPLDGSCNPDTRMRAGDGLRCQWSYALTCADKIAHKGWDALNWIFEKQEVLYGAAFDPHFEEFVKKLEVSPEEMKTCMGQSDTKDYVTAMASEGIKADVRGTPGIYMNGKRLDRGQFLPVLEAAYQKSH